MSEALYSDRRTPNAYAGDWYMVRRQALDRDDHRCQHCGKGRTEIEREPDVHHLTPIREFDDPQAAHSLDNVVALCRSCHRRAETGDISVSDLGPGRPSRDAGTNKTTRQ